MLNIRNAEPTDYEALRAFIAKENVYENTADMDFSTVETMLLIDGDMILGFAFARLIDYKPHITDLYIPEKLRGHLLGDALLRGLLYYLMNRGFEKAYALKDTAVSAFLSHEGFTENETCLEVILDDFFNQKCRGCRESH